MTRRIKVDEVIRSRRATSGHAGKSVFSAVRRACSETDEDVELDFKNVDLMNLEFLGNVIDPIFNDNAAKPLRRRVRISNMKDTMLDLVKEAVSAAVEKHLY